jgi:hypothetical protein
MPLPILAPLVTGIGAMLSRLIFSRMGPWIASAAVFLGLELAAIGVVLPELRSQVVNHLGSVPADLTAWMGVLKLDVYITVVMSAYAAALAKKAILRRRTA